MPVNGRMNQRNAKANKIQLVLTILGLFFFAFLLNMLTPYVADDYTYMLSIKTGKPITNILQVFPSVLENYRTITGRWLPHLFIQTLLMFPKWVFNAINAVVYTVFIYLSLRITARQKSINLIMAAGLVLLLWVHVASYGQVFLWICGSVNYLWAFVFALLYLLPYLRLLIEGEELMGKRKKIGFCVYTFFFGSYTENVSFAVIFVSFLLLLYVAVREKECRKYLCYFYPIVCGAIGYLTMFLAPGERRYTSDISAKAAWEFMGQIYLQFYESHGALLILAGILLVLNLIWKVKKEEILMALSFLLMGWICITMLCVGGYLENRSLAAGTYFLILCVLALLQNLRQEKLLSVRSLLPLFISAYFILSGLQPLYDGVYDIYDTNRRIESREKEILAEAAEGERTIYTYKLAPATSYPASYGLVDIPGDYDQVVWYNRAIGIYYGVDYVYGSWQ